MASRTATMTGLFLVMGLSAWSSEALAQPPETHQLGSERCATEGGDIEVRREGATITYWKGHFCSSTDCTTYEVKDFAADGQATVTVAGQYFDGGEISYRTNVHVGEPAWQHSTMMSVNYGAVISRDVRQIQTLFERTQVALANNATIVQCN